MPPVPMKAPVEIRLIINKEGLVVPGLASYADSAIPHEDVRVILSQPEARSVTYRIMLTPKGPLFAVVETGP